MTTTKTLYTEDDLLRMPHDGHRYELIEGELLVSRAPSLTHQRISRNLLIIIDAYLEGNPIGEVLATPGVMLGESNGVIPDLVFITIERRDAIASGERLTGAPDLVIEILSPGAENAQRDRRAKRQLYGKHGVKEYWVVDPESRVIEIYHSQSGVLELIRSVSVEGKISSALLPGFECGARSVFKI